MILYRYKGHRNWQHMESQYKTTIALQQLMRDIADDRVEVLMLDVEGGTVYVDAPKTYR